MVVDVPRGVPGTIAGVEKTVRWHSGGHLSQEVFPKHWQSTPIKYKEVGLQASRDTYKPPHYTLIIMSVAPVVQ